LPKERVYLIYLCFPNNPTGATITKEQLKKWVDFARETKAIILYDAAYEAFIRDEDLPHSIFEIEGAREVAIEFRSYSKTAGFTGTRCAFTVIPRECTAYDSNGNKHSLSMLCGTEDTLQNSMEYPIQFRKLQRLFIHLKAKERLKP
jgi:LL-diaminopimelate aminotransferase